MAKKRLDVLLFEKGLCESRERAKTTIMSGVVFVDGQRADKPGTPVSEDSNIEVRGAALEYVSRGGLKLERRSANSMFGLKGGYASTAARPQADSRIVSSRAAPRRYTPWMSDTDSSRGAYAVIRGWSLWSGQI